jgi:hypothetical protein
VFVFNSKTQEQEEDEQLRTKHSCWKVLFRSQIIENNKQIYKPPTTIYNQHWLRPRHILLHVQFTQLLMNWIKE